MNHEERITKTIKLDLKLQCSGQFYMDAYILVKGSITIQNRAAVGAANNVANKMAIFKNCASFTNCISRINNMQVDDVHDIDVVMSMYNLIEYSDNYSKTSGILWQFYRDALPLYIMV